MKLSVYNSRTFIITGIVKDTLQAKKHMIDNLVGKYENTAYAVDIISNEINVHKSYNEWIEGKAVKCKEGDVIDFYLDLDKVELSYAVNGKNYGKTHDVDGGCGY